LRGRSLLGDCGICACPGRQRRPRRPCIRSDRTTAGCHVELFEQRGGGPGALRSHGGARCRRWSARDSRCRRSISRERGSA